jgi:hypothetical protein
MKVRAAGSSRRLFCGKPCGSQFALGKHSGLERSAQTFDVRIIKSA